MHYRPGLHILSEIMTDHVDLLKDHGPIRKYFQEKITLYGLQSVGEVFHPFEEGGYTGVICLTESHLAIHTWPEYGIVTFDIYLSNFRKDNDPVTRQLFEDTVQFFKPKHYTRKEVKR